MQTDLPLSSSPSSPRGTSQETLSKLTADGGLTGMRLRVCEILARAEAPLTGAEVDEAANVDREARRGHLHKRLPELRDLGVVVEAEARVCRVTGNRAITWALSGNMPRGHLEKRVPLSSKVKALEAEVARLTRKNRALENEIAKLRQTTWA